MFNNKDDDEEKYQISDRLMNIVNTINPSTTSTYNQNNQINNTYEISDRLKNIVNSINPSNSLSDEELFEEEKNKLNNLWKFVENSKTENNQTSNSLTDSINENSEENLNANHRFRINNTKSKEEIDKQIQQASSQNIQSTSNSSENNINGIVNKDVKIGLASEQDTQNSQELSSMDIKAMNEANKKNENIEKGGKAKFEEIMDTILNNVTGGIKQTVSGLANLVTTAVGLGLKGLEGASKIVGLEENSNNINKTYNNVIDAGSNLNEIANYERLVNSQTEDTFTKTAGDVTNVISSMLTSSAIGYAIPVGISGTAIQGLSVAGNSAQETLNENKDNIVEASLTGIAKGFTSYLTERMFDANILTKGMKKTSIQEGIDKLISEKISSKFGKEFANRTVGIIGENIEELAEDNAGYLIDRLINDKEMPGFKEWWNNTTETAKTTTISTIIMGLLGFGGESFNDKEVDMEADYWIDQAQQIIEQEDLAIHFNPSEVKTMDNTKDFYITRFTPDGDIANIVPTRGKTIANPNENLNVKPAIVRDNITNFYTVIDENTGVVLDSTPYETTMEAESGFDEKVYKLSDLQVRDINQKVSKANYAVTNQLVNVINQAKEELSQMTPADYGVRTNENVQQNQEQERQNYENINKAINQISDKSIYNQTAVDNLLNIVSNNIYNIEYVPEDNGGGVLYSFDNDRNITAQQNINSKIYSGKKIKNIVNVAIEKAETTNLYQDTNTNNAQTSSEQNTNVSNSKSTNYAVQDIKKVTEPFNKQESYSRDELAETWNNEISQSNYDAYYDKNGNIERYIAIEEEGNNIVVNQYDNNDNIVRSAAIPSENGRYNSDDIRDTILKVSSNIDLSSYIQEMATNFQDDLANTLPGERYKAGDDWTGQKRSTTKELAEIKDETGASWNKIGEVLDDIANGRNNNTKFARTIEEKLDEALSEGYTNIYGKIVNSNEEYLNQKSKVYGRDFNTQTRENYDPTENMTDEDFRIFGMKKQNKKSNIEGNKVKSLKKKANNTTLSDEEIRNIVKYNPDGREIQDTDYVDFMMERFKDRNNISDVETTTTEVNTLLNETLEEAKNKVGTSEANKIRNKQKELMIGKLYSRIKNKKFKIIKKLKSENGNIETKELDIEISKNGLKESFNKSISNEKYAVVPFLDKLIQTSNSGTIRNETKLRQNIDEWYYLYNTAIVDNQLYGVKIDIKKTGQGDRFYVHRLNIIKEGTSNSESIFRDDTIRNNKIPSSTNSIAQKSQTVKNKTKQKTNKNQSNKTIKSLEDIKTKYKNQTDQLNIFENKDNTISINNLVVKQNLRNKGIGQRVLNDIIDYADKKGKTITLTPTSEYMTKNRLTNWYKKNGFVENKGRNTNYSISDTMYRLPKNSTNNNIRSMKQTTNKVFDSEGRSLTKQQQEYFKDSKVRDKNGNLLVMYHGTDRAFTEFKNKYIQHGRAVTDGFYLTPDRTNASEYGNNIMELYANIKNPLYLHNYNGVTRELIDRGYANDTDGLIKKYNLETDNSGVVPTAKALTKLVKKLGYDGIITTTNENDIIDTDWSDTQIVVFNSNQIKNITNSSPTSDKDIRYMKKNTSRSNTTQNNTAVDNQGRTLSKQQQEYFKDSKIRNSKGNLQTVYHTSKNDFTVFDPTKTEHYRFGKNNVNYYTDNKNMSLSYSLENPKLYEGYLNITNPYVINAQGAEWNKVNKTFDKTLIDKINKITPSLKQEIVSKAQETSQEREKMWNDYQNEVDKIYSLKNKITPSDKFYRVDELENLINKKVSSQRTSDEKEYLTLRKRSEQLYSNYNNYDETAEFYKYFENNKEFDSVVNSLSYKQKDELKTVSRNEFYEIAKLGFNQENIADRFGYYETTNDIVFNVLEENKSRKQKYDGVIIKNVVDYGNYSTYDGEGDVFVTFNSNQFKNVDNINPTSNQDIRFAKKSAKTVKTEGEILEPGQTNAQRESNYIEQEIRKIEQTGNWDDSIPVTKMTDIRKTIENYLGLGIQKGHFRQQAYGIYKGNRDVIRTKELKDIDTILHETGHALDIGNRIKLDKESISNELLKAVENYGGYEAETREVQLEEGFAEVIREYTIIPEQSRIDYPQTVSIIEGIRQENKDFDNFIKTVQQQTYNYIHQNPENRVLSNQSIGERTDQTKLTPAKIQQEVMRNIYDKDWALKSAVNEMQKINGKTTKDLKASENSYYLTRLASGIGDKIVSMLSKGYIDENGNKLMPGLENLGEILGNNEQRFNDLRAYLVAQRDLEYKAKTLKTGIRTMDSKAVVEQFKNDTQIQEASKLVYDTLDGVMQYAVNNGLIDQETADSLRESNTFYVPMQRVLEGNKNNVGRRGAVADIIKARTGSELDVKDVLENIVANSANIIQQVENNNILKALYNQGEQAGMTGKIYDVIDAPMVKIGTAKLSTWEAELKKQGVDTRNLDLEKTIDLFAPNNKVDANNLITSFINTNGKRVYLQFNDEVLFNSLMNMDKKFMSAVLNINRKLNMPLRYGATMANIGFAIPNMISDTAQATIFSEAGFIPVVDNVIGIMDILSVQNKTARNFFNKIMPGYADRINTLYAIYEQTGSTSATRLSQYREQTQNIMKDVYGTKNSEVLGIQEKFKPLKRLLDIMTYIPEISEQSTRFRVFEKNLEYYRKNGMAETDARIQAALQSRDATQDFGRTGNITREINQLIPFSAARIGSAYTFAEKVKGNPKRVASRMAVLMTISMAIKAIGYDDDEIEELNQRKKNDNFVMKIGDQIITIKKPQGILRSIVNLGEYVQDLFTGHIEEGKEGERLAELVQSAIMDNMPADSVTGLVPNMVAPVVENAINKDLYYNSDIVKSYDLELPDNEQYYDYNSQLAIWLGQIFNYSPAKIDNLISGYFAGLGTSVTNVIDWIAGKTGITSEQPEMGAEDNAVGKRFFVNVNSNSASVDEIYTLKTDLTKKKNGGTITTEEEQQLETITNAISEMSKLNKQIKEIKKDLTKSGKEKAEEIKELQRQKTDTARQALGKDLLYSENESKIESTKFYPSRDTLSKNNRTLTMDSEMKKEYEQIASEYYNRYASQGLYSQEKLEQIESKAKDYAKNEMMKKYKSELSK